MLSLRVASQKWTLFCVHYYSKLLMCIYINYIPLEAWVHCFQTAIVNWCWDNISMEIFKKKTDFFQYLARPPLWKKQESGKTWHHGFSFSCGCIRKQRLFKPSDGHHVIVCIGHRVTLELHYAFRLAAQYGQITNSRDIFPEQGHVVLVLLPTSIIIPYKSFCAS